MTIRARYVLLAIAVAVFASLVPVATAGDGLRLVEAGRATYPDRAFILTLPGKRTLTAQNIEVRENGALVRDVSLTAAGSTGAEDTGVVLVIDASRSMRGKAMQDALAAARAFAARRPPNQEVGVVAFDRTSSVVLQLTSDEEKIDAALARSPKMADGTHLYDGVDAALTLLDESDAALGTVIVLSDGADTGSKATAAAVADEARKAGVRVFTVGVRSPQFRSAPLRKLSSDTAGSYAQAASTADLARVYSQLGARLASEYVLRYRSESPQRRVRVAVRVDGIPGWRSAATRGLRSRTPDRTRIAIRCSRGSWSPPCRRSSSP